MFLTKAVLKICNKFPREHLFRSCSVKNVFSEISQNLQENTCARVSFLINMQASGLSPATLSKKRLWHRCFSCEFCEIFKNTFSYRTPLVAASVGKDLVYKMMTILIFKYLKRFYINILF